MHEAARRALAEDGATIAALYRQALAEIAGHRGGALLAAHGQLDEPLEASLDRLLEAPDRLVLVGTLDGEIVAFALASVAPATPGRSGEATALVGPLYVEPEAREVGVGEALLDEVKAWAAAEGVVGIDLPVLPGARAAKNFLEGAGFAARLLVMHHPLAAGGEDGAGSP